MITFKSDTRGARLIISKLDFSTEISNSTSETLNALVCKVNPDLKEPSSIIHWPKATGLNKIPIFEGTTFYFVHIKQLMIQIKKW